MVGEELDLLADLEVRLELRLARLESTLGAVVAQLALAQADIKGLQLDVEDLLNSLDEARRAAKARHKT